MQEKASELLVKSWVDAGCIRPAEVREEVMREGWKGWRSEAGERPKRKE